MEFYGSKSSSAWSLNSLANNYHFLFRSLEKLSSGRKLNSAVDGPATLMISTRLQSQIATLGQEINNISGSIHKYETVSASVLELRGELTELRSLAIAAVNEGFNSEEMQAAYARAAGAIVEGYNRTVAESEYNGRPTLVGSEGSLVFLSPLSGVDLSSPGSAAASLELIDAAASEVDSALMELGSVQKHELESRLQSLRVTRQNLTAAESIIGDTDYAMEFSTFLARQIQTEAGMALLGYSTLSAQTILTLL